MGCNCAKASGPQLDGGDLPAINLAKIKDHVEHFEKGFPFHRMHVNTMATIVHSFGRDSFSIDDLKSRLQGQIW